MGGYLKIKSYQALDSRANGNAILWILAYDEKGARIPLNFSNVVQHDYTVRNSEANFNVMLEGRNASPWCPYNDNSVSSGCFITLRIPDYITKLSKVEVCSYSNSSYLNKTVEVYVSSSPDGGFKLIHTKEATAVSQTLTFGEVSFPVNKTLMCKDDTIYSLKIINETFETKMTSDTAPSPLNATASSTFSSSFSAWRAFDGIKDGNAWASASGTPTGWIKIDFGKAILVNNVTLTRRGGDDPVIAQSMPKDFNIYASNNNIDFDLVGSFRDEIGWGSLENRNFRFNNSKEYRFFRLDVLANNGLPNYSSIGEILYGYDMVKIIQLPKITKDNFVRYGQDDTQIMSDSFRNKDYILQNVASKNRNGLLETELNRKPLSINFN